MNKQEINNRITYLNKAFEITYLKNVWSIIVGIGGAIVIFIQLLLGTQDLAKINLIMLSNGALILAIVLIILAKRYNNARKNI